MRHDNHSFPYSLLLLAASVIAYTAPSTGGEQEPLAEKRVTFYTSYGYLEDDNWTIPLRIWVSEESDTLRQSVAAFARDKLMERSGLESLDMRWPRAAWCSCHLSFCQCRLLAICLIYSMKGEMTAPVCRAGRQKIDPIRVT